MRYVIEKSYFFGIMVKLKKNSELVIQYIIKTITITFLTCIFYMIYMIIKYKKYINIKKESYIYIYI